MPLISIVTPVYNATRWLAETLASVRAQTLTDWEQILVDDGSTDGSQNLIEAANRQDPRVHPVLLSKNQGPAEARNAALEQARGRYIAFLDADDLWLPRKLEDTLAVMAAHGYGFAYHDYRHMSYDGKRIGALVHGPELLTRKSLHTQRGIGSCLTVVLDRQIISDVRFPLVAPYHAEDFCLWLRILQSGHTGHRIPLDLGRYRLTPQSRSANKWNSARNTWRLYRQISHLTPLQAGWWWTQYAWNAATLHWRARPH